jgi:tRNA (guanine37-N1)-methyltransferase
VVNKTSSIHDEYRTLPMELIAGQDAYQVVVREGKCRFEFDFRTVFWNSRLENEHLRLVQLLREGDVLIDMFAGVGPYAVPAAKRGAQVWANDLNPHCYTALQHNASTNLKYVS